MNKGVRVFLFFKAAVEIRSIPKRDLGLPRGLRSKDSVCQGRRRGFHP